MKQNDVTYQVVAVKSDGSEQKFYEGTDFKAAQSQRDETLDECRSGQIEDCLKVQIRDNIHGEFLNFITEYTDGHPGF